MLFDPLFGLMFVLQALVALGAGVLLVAGVVALVKDRRGSGS